MIRVIGPAELVALSEGASPGSVGRQPGGVSIDVVDVREANEWATGRVSGARHVPLAQFRGDPAAALPGGADTPVVFVCAKGARSAQATQGGRGLSSLLRGGRARRRCSVGSLGAARTRLC